MCCVLTVKGYWWKENKNEIRFLILTENFAEKMVATGEIEFSDGEDEYNALEDNLSEEINQRVNLGNDLTDKITKETSDRKTADSSIEGKISTEIVDRKKADSSA